MKHDGYMCRVWLPIIQVTAKSTAINNSQAAFLVLNYFSGRSGKGCIHTVYMRPSHHITLSSKNRPWRCSVNEWCFWKNVDTSSHQRSSLYLCNRWVSEGGEMTALANFRWNGWKTGSCHGDADGLNCLTDWVSAQGSKFQEIQCGVAGALCPTQGKYIGKLCHPPHLSVSLCCLIETSTYGNSIIPHMQLHYFSLHSLENWF